MAYSDDLKALQVAFNNLQNAWNQSQQTIADLQTQLAAAQQPLDTSGISDIASQIDTLITVATISPPVSLPPSGP